MTSNAHNIHQRCRGQKKRLMTSYPCAGVVAGIISRNEKNGSFHFQPKFVEAFSAITPSAALFDFGRAGASMCRLYRDSSSVDFGA